MKTIMTSIPVVRSNHSERLFAYSGGLTAADIIPFVGHDFRSKFWKNLPEDLRNTYKEVQRTTAPGRARSLEVYIRDRMIGTDGLPGALPPIAIVVAEPVDFSPIDPKLAFGAIAFPVSALRIIGDGIGRSTAILNLLDQKFANLPDLPVVIYAPKAGRLTKDAISQIFADFNGKGAKLTPAAAGARDRSSPIGNVGKEMIKLAVLKPVAGKKWGISEDKAFRFVRALFEKVATDKQRNTAILGPILKNGEEAQASDVIRYFWTRFGADLGGALERSTTLIFRSAAYNAIAFTLAELTGHRPLDATRERIEQIAAAMATIDWDESAADWLQKITYDVGDGTVAFMGNTAAFAPTLNYVLQQTKAALAE